MGIRTVDRGVSIVFLLGRLAVALGLVGGVYYLHRNSTNAMEAGSESLSFDPLPGIADITVTGVDERGRKFYQSTDE